MKEKFVLTTEEYLAHLENYKRITKDIKYLKKYLNISYIFILIISLINLLLCLILSTR